MKSRLAPILGCLVFLLAGLALLPWPGLQNDELFFSGPIYSPGAAFYYLELGSTKIPLMVMSYSGALKTWLYAGLFQVFPPDQWSVRLPVLFMGMATIWLTWVWVKRLAGPRAAAVTVALLSTDTIFLMTNLFDWGPVAIQHLLLMAGLVAAPQNLVLAAGLWGLGLWDKALLIWPLIGLGLASFVLFPKEFVRHLRPRTLGLAMASFLLGALPLVWYNVARPGETATQNTHLSLAEMRGKPLVLQQTIQGSTLFGYMVFPGDTAPKAPRSLFERASVKIANVAGDHAMNWMVPAWLIGFVFSFFLWRSPHFRLILFLLLATAIIWLQMALTKGTGGAAHHTILLWPFPAVILGFVFSEVASRLPRFGPQLLWAAVAVLCAQNLLTTNQYLARFIVNGPGGGWTDALDNLAQVVDHKRASWYGLVDWGYLTGLQLFHEGDLPLFSPHIPAEGQELSDADRPELLREVSNPEFLFIRHTDDKQMFPGVNQRLHKAAASLGYSEVVEKTVADHNGRPVFELFRFRKQL
ncbi:MAG: hypothetical protein JWN34_3793 [Bryobacterales bacterium]|nr:hypothetical protein [Bryobacterales bacterium]